MLCFPWSHMLPMETCVHHISAGNGTGAHFILQYSPSIIGAEPDRSACDNLVAFHIYYKYLQDSEYCGTCRTGSFADPPRYCTLNTATIVEEDTVRIQPAGSNLDTSTRISFCSSCFPILDTTCTLPFCFPYEYVR